MEGYQVSNQCMALVRDACFIPTKDAPELGYIKESSDKQYVPDVYYKVSVFLFLFYLLYLLCHPPQTLQIVGVVVNFDYNNYWLKKLDHACEFSQGTEGCEMK